MLYLLPAQGLRLYLQSLIIHKQIGSPGFMFAAKEMLEKEKRIRSFRTIK